MEDKKVILKQIEELEKQKEPLQNKLNKLYKKESDEVEAKIKRCNAMKDKFDAKDLLFSAYSRCACGAGLAYPEGIGMHGAWYCSDILLGRATAAGQEGAKTHDDGFPFAFYEIKSENQPSANGATTRPKDL